MNAGAEPLVAPGVREQVSRRTDAIFDQLVALRRHLHAHPEPSGEEYHSALHMHQWLSQHQIASRLVADGRGVLLDLGDSAQARFGLRADLDALRIHDAKQVEYRSTIDNVMHACGHDVHATILAGSLVVLRQLQDSSLALPVQVRGIFQPSEETCVGAKEMISEGALASVQSIFALHVDPTRPLGTIGFRKGAVTASCDELLIEVRGQGGHAARPHYTRDPITAAAQFISAVHVQLPRRTDSLDTIVVGFGCIQGGQQCNVIPETVQLRGTLRTLSSDTREKAIEQLGEIARGIGRMSQTEIDLTIGAGTPSVYNDHMLTDIVDRVTRESMGDDAALWMERPSMGGEDFAYYLKEVPGAMARLGVNSGEGAAPALHTPSFDVDEQVIRYGVNLMVNVAIAWQHMQSHG